MQSNFLSSTLKSKIPYLTWKKQKQTKSRDTDDRK